MDRILLGWFWSFTYLWISVNRVWMRIWLIASWNTVSLDISHHSVTWWYNGWCQRLLQLLLLLSIFSTAILKPNLQKNKWTFHETINYKYIVQHSWKCIWRLSKRILFLTFAIVFMAKWIFKTIGKKIVTLLFRKWISSFFPHLRCAFIHSQINAYENNIMLSLFQFNYKNNEKHYILILILTFTHSLSHSASFITERNGYKE